jgi:hypothetical protein
MTLLNRVRKMRQMKGRRPCLTPSTPPNITSMPPNITNTPPSIIAKPPPMWRMAITRRARIMRILPMLTTDTPNITPAKLQKPTSSFTASPPPLPNEDASELLTPIPSLPARGRGGFCVHAQAPVLGLAATTNRRG